MPSRDLPPLDSISVEELTAVLRANRARGKEPRGRLLYLQLVTSCLRRKRLRDSASTRGAILGELLGELSWSKLCEARGQRNGHVPSISADAAERLVEDFAPEAEQRAAWSALWYRYLSPVAMSGAEIEQQASVSRATRTRRLAKGIELLLHSLLAAEAAAREDRPSPDTQAAPAKNEGERAEAQRILERVREALREGRRDALDLAPDARRLILGRAWDSLDLYRLRQALLWSDERYQLDERFVDLSLLIDLGEETMGDRWRVKEERYTSLVQALGAQPDPVFVLLGAPGSGKSTLLRHHELGLALDGLRGATERIGIFVPLGRYGSQDDGAPLEAPLTWLAEQWKLSQPGLPSLHQLLESQQVTLLLDAVNEMPHHSPEAYLERVGRWQAFVADLVGRLPGNRVVFSCRSLDYSAPLSSKDLAVPQLRIEPLDDLKVQAFLQAYCPSQAEKAWTSLEGRPELGLLRTPFLLRMLALQAERQGTVPTGRAALFSSFLRGALRTEVEGGNPRFKSGRLLNVHDRWRILNLQRWDHKYVLPGDGLFPPLAELAFRMQDQHDSTEAAQVRLPYHKAQDHLMALLQPMGAVDERAELLALERAEAILLAGQDLNILDQDRSQDELLFRHQLLQEYFAARKLAGAPRPELAASEWRADVIQPSVEALIATLPPAEPLPPLPGTGWEETMLLAAAMAPDKDAFVTGLAKHNLPLAGRCAAQPEGERLSDEAIDRLRWALVDRSRDPAADLRARIAAGEALGELGDPRFKRCKSAEGVEYLLPPMVRVPGGRYWIGSDEGSYPDVLPRQEVEVETFWIGQFPVTNAEYACFIAADGYEDPRWWVGEAAQRWWRGEGTDDAEYQQECEWYERFGQQPNLLEELRSTSLMPERNYHRWKQLLSLSRDRFLAVMASEHAGGAKRLPRYWRSNWHHSQSEPVVGISWFEASAYCLWLGNLMNTSFRLPRISDQMAMRQLVPHDLAGNVRSLRLLRLCPVTVFPARLDTAEVYDVAGNASEWCDLDILSTGQTSHSTNGPCILSSCACGNAECSNGLVPTNNRHKTTPTKEICPYQNVLPVPRPAEYASARPMTNSARIGPMWAGQATLESINQWSPAPPDHRTRDAGFRVASDAYGPDSPIDHHHNKEDRS